MKILVLLLSCIAASAGLKVDAAQFRASASLDDNSGRIVATVEKLASAKVDVAVFRECALTSYSEAALRANTADAVAAAGESIHATCRARHIATVVGSVQKINGKLFNMIMLAGEHWATPGNWLLQGVE